MIVGYAVEIIFGKDQMVKGIVKSFVHGNCDTDHANVRSQPISEPENKDYRVDRGELLGLLRTLIRPVWYVSKYTVIVGENGVGKTTAVKDALCSIQGNKGAIYFLIQNPKYFSRRLSKVLNFRISTFSVFDSILLKSEYTVDPVLDHEPLATWNLMQPALEEAARIYKKKYKQIVSLILDGVDNLAKYDVNSGGLSILEEMQMFAKNMADQRLLNVMFVTSDGLAISVLSKSSAISRAALFEVGDISDAQALEYLKRRGVNQSDSLRAVELLSGGRFEIMLDFYQLHKGGVPFHEILHRRHEKIGRRLGKLSMTCNHTLFHVIFQKSAVNDVEFRRLNLSWDVQEELVKSNLLSQHVNLSYSFHDRGVRSFFQMAWDEAEAGSLHRAKYCYQR